jgi:hypothetical protein
MVVDSANSSIGGHAATITDSAIGWEIITRNGFGGATHTQYEIDRNSGTVTANNTYVNPRGYRAVSGHYAGECYVRHRAF